MIEKFFNDLFSATHKKAEDQEQEFQNQRDQNIKMYEAVLFDPTGRYSPEQRAKAAQEIGKLRNIKKGQNPYENLASFLNTLGEHIQNRRRDPSSTPAPSTVPSAVGGSGGGGGGQQTMGVDTRGLSPSRTPTSSGASRPATLPPLTAEGPKAGFGRKLLGTVTRGLGMGAELAGAAMGSNVGQPSVRDLPPINASVFQPSAGSMFGFDIKRQYIGEDDKMHYVWRNKDTGETRETTSDEEVRGYNRPVKGNVLSKEDAMSLIQGGQQMIGPDDKPLDPSQLPDNVALQGFIRDKKLYYIPFSPTQKTVTAFGRTYVVTQYGLIDLANKAGGDLGPKTMPKTSERETQGVDAQGNPVTNILGTTTTPAAPGIPGMKQGVAPGTTPKSLHPLGGPTSTPNSVPAPKPTGDGRVETHHAASGGKIRGGRPLYPTSAQWNQAIQRVVPVREAATQLFGDPSHPELRSLASFAKLADDPAASANVAKAVRLTFDGINTEINNSGGLWTYMNTVGGVPGLLAAAKAQLQKANMPLKPEEQAAYDAVMSSYSTVIGLRSLTKASAAQASVTKIENEIPIPGYNVANSQQFYDQLSKLAEVMANGMRTLPDYAMSPEDKKYFSDLVDKYGRQGAGGVTRKGLPKIGGTDTGGAGDIDIDGSIMRKIQAIKNSQSQPQAPQAGAR